MNKLDLAGGFIWLLFLASVKRLLLIALIFAACLLMGLVIKIGTLFGPVGVIAAIVLVIVVAEGLLQATHPFTWLN